MKKILQQIFINSISLFATSSLFSGLKIAGGAETIIIGGVILTIGFMIIKPIIDILTLPIRILTLGLSSPLATIFIVYLLTRFYPKVQIISFKFPQIQLWEIRIESFFVSVILSYVVISGTIYILDKVIAWVFEK